MQKLLEFSALGRKDGSGPDVRQECHKKPKEPPEVHVNVRTQVHGVFDRALEAVCRSQGMNQQRKKLLHASCSQPVASVVAAPRDSRHAAT